jgi:hypothetical protein
MDFLSTNTRKGLGCISGLEQMLGMCGTWAQSPSHVCPQKPDPGCVKMSNYYCRFVCFSFQFLLQVFGNSVLYICVCVYIYICINIHICVYVCMCVYMYIYYVLNKLNFYH